MVRFQTTTLTRALGVNLELDGVLPRLGRADHPLHLINPLAPAEYGTGFENLSVNPRTHQVEGISFLTFAYVFHVSGCQMRILERKFGFWLRR